MHKVILKTEQLVKNYDGINILNGLDFKLHQGESVAIMGASGEGKTTLLHLLGGMEKPTSGKIFYQEEELTSQNALSFRSKHFSYIFQFFHLLEELSALDNVLMPAYISTRAKKPFKEKALSLLDEVGLLSMAHKRVKAFSGGEKQRVAIARAFLTDPEIIFADEPSGNLDHQNSQKIGALLLDFVKAKKKSLILVTHNEQLAELCSHRYLLKNGTLEAEKETAKILS